MPEHISGQRQKEIVGKMGGRDGGYTGHIHEYDKETGMCICRKINPSKRLNRTVNEENKHV